MKSGIYAIKNKINGKHYVGKAMDIPKRFNNHKHCLKKNKHRNDFLQKAWNKYGEKQFDFVVLELCEVKYLDEKEIYWIEKLKSHKTQNGYNLTFGGDGGILSDYSRQKLSDKMKGKKLSKEHVEKLRKAHIGKKRSKEHKENIKKNNAKYWKGKKRDPETIEKIRQSKLGKKMSKSSSEKKREAMKKLYANGFKNPQMKLTDEQIIQIYIRSNNGEKQRDLANEFGISQGSVSSIKNGKNHRNIIEQYINGMS